MAVSIDDAFQHVGSMGRYQIRLVAMFLFCAFCAFGFQALLITFIAAEPGWTCAENSTACNFTEVQKPGSDMYKKRCDMNRSDWEFTKEFNSAVTQWELVCDRSILQSVSTSSIFAGWLLGAIVLSWVSDKTGRRKVAYFGSLLIIAFALLGAASPYFWMFVLCRAIVGFGIGGTSLNQFVLITEFVGPQHRNLAGTLVWFAWTFSYMALALFAYFLRDWQILTIVVSVTGIPFVLFWWFIPESVRWLLVKGRVMEGERILKDVAEFNKKEPLNEPLLVTANADCAPTASFFDLFRDRKMARLTIILWVAWAVNSMVYYGVSLSSPSLGGNMYFNFFLTSIIEIPSNGAAIYVMKKFGRKKSTVIPMILASFAAIGAVLLMKDTSDKGFYAGRIIMAMLAKFFILISFDSIYVYSAELLPTVVRNLGMGTASACGRAGSFLSSYVVWLERVHKLLPYGVMAAASLVAGLLCILLPETKDQPMPEVLEREPSEIELIPQEDSNQNKKQII
ncbi:organic cation transporter protein [Exaiptasia diaphana]|uniref:Major facilitator superfamily (MFS) profile domain-containing protein n=1 Tax=Exaiptasia diaphana TaxID=2652724 RepID=A0A913XE18_EXADI|nr:organic cation transporter protein [Exaiptasia diaphana]KXJ29686.1 Organic cation transporter protein [Exaiptasia diaphana]